jgi:cellulose synthase/poly-beta-1,6-N-acetylglucosamine synthase-like glycosyltransferase
MLGLVLLIGSSLYGLWILWNWLELSAYSVGDSENNSEYDMHPLKLLVCVRNETERIQPLLNSILESQRAGTLEEVIFVDDHSADGTSELIHEILGDAQFQVLSLDEKSFGKKAALMKGLGHLNGSIVLLTDADCSFGPEWPLKMCVQAKEANAALLAGSVAMVGENGLLHFFQRLDWYAQQFIWTSRMVEGYAFLMSSANALIDLSEMDISKIDLDMRVPSGDDIQLIRSVDTSGLSIAFAQDSVVRTQTVPDWNTFWEQRLRWASKLSIYKDRRTLGIFLTVAGGHLLYLITTLVWLTGSISPFSFLSITLVRIIPDILAVRSVSRRCKDELSLWGALILWFIYPYYLIILQSRALRYKPKWKERHYS